MAEASTPSLLVRDRPGRLALLAGKLLTIGYKIGGWHEYDDYRLERVHGMRILVIPTVANPKVLRTGAFFASRLDGRTVALDADVLDLGTGSGICALFAARHSGRVVATDINPSAIRCARINATMNGLDGRIAFREGNLFAPVAAERFDLVLFNPPFYLGNPRDHRDSAWRSADTAERFARGLKDHLKPHGEALVLLSSLGDACALFETNLISCGFRLDIFAQRRYVNELLTIVRVKPRRFVGAAA